MAAERFLKKGLKIFTECFFKQLPPKSSKYGTSPTQKEKWLVPVVLFFPVVYMLCMSVCETPKSRLNTRVAAAEGGRVSHHGSPMGSHQTKTEPSFTQNSSPLLAMMMMASTTTMLIMLMMMCDGTDPPLTQNLLFSLHGHGLHSDDQHRHLSPLRSWIEEGGGWN